MPYRTLNADRIVRTLERLKARIEERFPGRGIVGVCAELVELAKEDASRAEEMVGPIRLLRVLTGLVILAAIALGAYGIYSYRTLDLEFEAFHAFQGIEALINILLLSGAGIWFLLNLEARIKRARILADLHELRAIAHVIDMHQLTKDPTAILNIGQRTKSSPERDMDGYQLSRYLDYCAEMLALTGKLAALYLRASRDPVVIQAVNEIEDLTAGLTRKIWQKITLIPEGERSAPGGAIG